ncbi:hypothetical protein [Spiroplasma apis]|uniref:Transmembrane protein n=1 Tax=Spiroplasma apis B31 TaxID=1276258 RepID=V5RIP6_SPIAP|nr:hypothetical protein [Spiroplasma apis]AHB36542.1 hypothetical protein SAPIS_v1c06970 [Spiroplasma apis B31]
MGHMSKNIDGKLGEVFTKRFLKSKYVNMVSEGDYLARLSSCCKATWAMIFQCLWIAFFLYARFVVGKQYNNSLISNEAMSWLYKEQLSVLNSYIYIQIYHIFILSTVLIVMLNMTMGVGTTIYTVFFNLLFISEALLYGSFIFILDWTGLLHSFKNISFIWEVLKTQWLWLLCIFIAVWSFIPMCSIFKDVNMLNREWIRVDRYRKTEDKENEFVFKTWVTPGEIKSRKGMIIAGWFAILTASIFELCDVFIDTNFTVMKYIILIFGYVVFLGAYVIPYSKISLIFYWVNQTFLLCLFIYSLYLVQNKAYISGYRYYYAYLAIFVPWFLSFKASIRYTWTIKDREEIKAIVLNSFESQDEFEEFLEERNNTLKEAATTI